jgi:hypothetical protein
MDAYQLFKSTEGLSEKERTRKLYEHQIVKYEGEVKGFQIMIRREELSEHHWQTKLDNINSLKSELRKARYNFTRTKTLLSNLDKPPILNYSI